MYKRCKRSTLLMRRYIRWDETNPVQFAAFHGCPRQCQVTLVHWVKRPAEKANIHENF
jgi:hypothetical protein